MKNFNKGGFKKQGFGGKNFGGRQNMHRAVCSDCGNACEVPFKPAPGKSVYCSQCFKRDDDFGGGGNARQERGGFGQSSGKRDFGRPDFAEKRMHQAVCAECGNTCEVPFRPTGEKPVYCRDCFGGNRSGERRDIADSGLKKPNPSDEKFDQLNKKLDKILKALEMMNIKKTFIIDKPAEKAETEPVNLCEPEPKPVGKKTRAAKKPVKKAASAKKAPAKKKK